MRKLLRQYVQDICQMLSSLQSPVCHLSDMQVSSCKPAPSNAEFVMFMSLKGKHVQTVSGIMCMRAVA